MKRLVLCLCVVFSLANAAAAKASGSRSPLFAENFLLLGVSPRVFSPQEGAAEVNRVRFRFDNPDACEVTIRIYDASGSLVRRNLEREEENVMFWDGRDGSGRIAKGGIYLYQIEAGRKAFQGMIVLAK